MIPNPIVKVLSTLSCHEVRHLLMGGQACVFYGAAEFSRDCDIVLLSDQANFARLTSALAELKANCIAVPPFEIDYLRRGHAVHFRCEHPDAAGIRIDVMTKMRGVDEFVLLWQRRTTLADPDGTTYELLGIHDLIKAKKTQRDKDWPMIRRLVESHFTEYKNNATAERVDFWLRELRTPAMLIEVVANHADEARELAKQRPLLPEVFAASETALAKELLIEQNAQQEADKAYWTPLKRELETLRRQMRR
ncbi:MAG: hypothetical protein ABI614_05285 [Planctomycetota bacterium]